MRPLASLGLQTNGAAVAPGEDIYSYRGSVPKAFEATATKSCDSQAGC